VANTYQTGFPPVIFSAPNWRTTSLYIILYNEDKVNKKKSLKPLNFSDF